MEEHPPLNLGVVALERGAFESPSTKFVNFTYFLEKVKWSSSSIIDNST